MNQVLGFPFIAILENLGCSLQHSLDLPLGFEGKCTVLSGGPYFSNFHENYSFLDWFKFSGIKAAPCRLNGLDF